MRKPKQIAGSIALLIVSTALAVVAAEFVSRLILDPVDYLKPRLVKDEILKHRIEPNSGGHDEWGFRNKEVPESADIVAIGDSQTYGVAATSTGSWPAALARVTGRSVYNLSLGGYGAIQYLHLLETKAFELDPSVVVVGLYYGNDIHEAFSAVYNIDHWRGFRDPAFAAALDSIEAARAAARSNVPDIPTDEPAGAMRGALSVREWLTYHSVLYRVFEASPIGNLLRRSKLGYMVPEEEVTTVDLPHDMRTAFTPRLRRKAVDLNDPRMREGVRVTQEAFRRMRDDTEKRGVKLLVALLPSKERVYAKFIEHNSALAHSEVIDELIANERRIDATMKESFAADGIDYVDTLPALEAAAGETLVYPSNPNSHPNANGYAVIAETIAGALNSID